MIGIITIQQFSLISGLKRFGDRGKHAVTNELTQLHDKIYIYMDPEMFSKEERACLMESLMFLVENIYSILKYRF